MGGAWGGAGDCLGGAGGRGCDWVGELAGSESRVGLGAAWEDTAGVGAVLTLQDLLLLSHGQSCLTLCDLMDCSLPGSPVHGISQARVLEWGAIAFSDYRVWSGLNVLRYLNPGFALVFSVFLPFCVGYAFWLRSGNK